MKGDLSHPDGFDFRTWAFSGANWHMAACKLSFTLVTYTSYESFGSVSVLEPAGHVHGTVQTCDWVEMAEHMFQLATCDNDWWQHHWHDILTHVFSSLGRLSFWFWSFWAPKCTHGVPWGCRDAGHGLHSNEDPRSIQDEDSRSFAAAGSISTPIPQISRSSIGCLMYLNAWKKWNNISDNTSQDEPRKSKQESNQVKTCETTRT